MELNFKKMFWQWLPWVIIALGLIFRLDQYLFNRSLWLDEAFIAVNIAERTFSELLKPPLEYSSYIVPPAFLLMEKLSVTLFGNSDLILRFFPFLSGSLAMILYYPMAKRYVSERAVPVALLLFAISGPLIFYSSELKQYSSDVLIVIILFWLTDIYRTSDLTLRRLLTLTIAGTVAVWFSHPSVFILAAIGIYITVPYLLKRDWLSVARLIAVFLVWLLNFAIIYLFFIRFDTISNIWMRQFWTIENAFMPLPFSKEGFVWLCKTLLMILKYPGNLENVHLAGYLVIIGTIALFRNRKRTLFLIILPILTALTVSFFKQYAFSGRLLLFLMPGLYLIIAESIVQIKVTLSIYPKTALITVVIQLILLANIVDYPVYRRKRVQEIKPVLEYMEQTRQNKDTTYLYYWSEPAFRYYAARYNFNFEDCHMINPVPDNEYCKEVDYFRKKMGLKPVTVAGTQLILGTSESFNQSKADLDKLKNHGRVWFLFSHINEHERTLFLNYLDTLGKRLDQKTECGAFTYLYEL